MPMSVTWAKVRVLVINRPRNVPAAVHVFLDIGQRLEALHQALQVFAAAQDFRLQRQPVVHRVVGHDVHVGDALAQEPAARTQVSVQQLVEHGRTIRHGRQVQLIVFRSAVADIEEVKAGVLDLRGIGTSSIDATRVTLEWCARHG